MLLRETSEVGGIGSIGSRPQKPYVQNLKGNKNIHGSCAFYTDTKPDGYPDGSDVQGWCTNADANKEYGKVVTSQAYTDCPYYKSGF